MQKTQLFHLFLIRFFRAFYRLFSTINMHCIHSKQPTFHTHFDSTFPNLFSVFPEETYIITGSNRLSASQFSVFLSKTFLQYSVCHDFIFPKQVCHKQKNAPVRNEPGHEC